jgi:hypothetical protein
MIFDILHFIICFCCIWFLLSQAKYFFDKEKIIHVSHPLEWKKVSRNCFEELNPSQELIITDGKRIKSTSVDCLDYNANGTPIMSTYFKNPITHWMFYPGLPKKEEK